VKTENSPAITREGDAVSRARPRLAQRNYGLAGGILKKPSVWLRLSVYRINGR